MGKKQNIHSSMSLSLFAYENLYSITMKWEESIKDLGVLLDQYLTSEHNNKTFWKKIAKNIGILYKARPSLDKGASTTHIFTHI